MKRLISMLIILSMTCALFPFAIPASANPLPGDTVVVDASLTGETGTPVELVLGDNVWSVIIGVTGFAKVSAALEAVYLGIPFHLGCQVALSVQNAHFVAPVAVVVSGPFGGVFPLGEVDLGSVKILGQEQLGLGVDRLTEAFGQGGVDADVVHDHFLRAEQIITAFFRGRA